MGKKYGQLSIEERGVLAVGLQQGLSLRGIADLLDRNVSTVSRELKRNANPHDDGVIDCGAHGYVPINAADRCKKRKFHHKKILATSPELWREVQAMMRQNWSPEQIAGRLKNMNPDDPTQRVSHETIYAHIYAYPRGALRTEMIKLLRKSHKTRKPRARGEDRRGKLVDTTSIALRPKDVETRAIAGHWEGDLIKGAFNRSSVGTFAERTSRFTIVVKLDDATKETVHLGFVRELKKVPQGLLLSLTYDCGKEMALHKQVAADLHLTVYFADPHSPWQRGSNENMNGLLRQYLPKSTDLSVYSQEQLNEIADKLNDRPRKILGFRTPREVYEELCLASTKVENMTPVGAA